MMTIVASTVESCQEGIILGNEIGNDTVEEIANNNLPVTLVVSKPSVLAHINQNANTDSSTHEEPVISTLSLQDGETNAQYFIEHITSSTDNMSETTYTIHLTEDQPPDCVISDEQETLTTSNADLTVSDPPSAHLEHVTLSEDSNLHLLATSSRLEDFVDVVTTYKCKFCHFSCAWKTGLMSHFQSCHLETNTLPVTQPNNAAEQLEDLALKQNMNVSTNDDNKVIGEEVNSTEGENKETTILLNASDSQPKSNDVSCLNDNDLDLASSNSSPHSPPQECNTYLCGQCSKEFNSLDGCKQHMIKDHSIKMDISSEKSRPESQGHSHTTPALNSSNCLFDDEEDEEEDDYNDDAAETDMDINNLEGNCKDDNDLSESSGKKQIRPPRALEEDYYLGTKNKRVIRQNMIGRTFRCSNKGCGYCFTTEAYLHYHSRCHTVPDKPFTCPECSETCDRWRKLAIHLWKQHRVDMDLHTCPICGYKTFNISKLENHKRIHSDEREFVCTTCGKGFKQPNQLQHHNVVHHLDRKNLSEKRWRSKQECDICHRTFSGSNGLKKHKQVVHNKLKPYMCSYCGYTSATKTELQRHMHQHTGEKPYKCDHCEYKTGDYRSLRRHLMRHTGKKPYRCPHCSYACIQSISYKAHLKNKHPGMEGLYSCSLCTFSSVSKKIYINHMLDHKQGMVQAASTSNANINNKEQNSLANEEGNDNQAAQESTQLHVTEGTLQQLQGILPGNVSAAQFISSCLNALGQEGGTINLPAGITTTTARDGTQTIAIQLPASSQENLEQEQFHLTIQHQDSTTPTTIVIPNIKTQVVNTVTTSDTTDTLAIQQPIVTQDDSGQPLDTSAFVTADGDSATVVIASNADVPAETESATSLLQEVSPC